MNERPLRHPAAWIAAAAVLALAVWVFARPGMAHLARFAIGDAMAYLRVSWSIANGQGSTYDGLQPTNGYHPLWMLLHVPLMIGAAAPLDRLDAARALWGLTTLLATGAWATLVWRVTHRVLPAALVALGIGGTGWTVFVLDSGMETPLALLMIALAFLATERVALQPSPTRGALAGLALGAAVLARLDAVLLLVPLGLVLAWELRARPPALAALIGAGLATVMPYFLWNIINFQSLQPVSGQVKTREAWLDPTPLWVWWKGQAALLAAVGLSPTLSLIVGIAALLAFSVPGLLVLGGAAGRRAPWLGLLPVGALLHYGYYAARIYEINVPWHVFIEFATVVVLGALAVDRVAQRLQLAVVGQSLIVGACALGLFAADGVYVRMKEVRRGEVQLHLEIAEHLAAQPPGARVLMYDSWFVGAIAHQQHLVDMSGLIGDATTAKAAKAREYDAIIERFQIEAVVIVGPSTCEAHGPAVRWASADASSLTRTRAWLVGGPAFVRAWRALPADVRRTQWTARLRDELICAPAAAPSPPNPEPPHVE